MLKFFKFALLLFGLLVLAYIVFPFVAYQVAYRLDQPHQREVQARILDGNFTKVQRQNGKVLMITRNDLVFRTPTPLLLSVGSQFKANDRHWGATYTITKIEPDGVVIHFEASGGGVGTPVRSSSGNVKLGWK